MEELITGEKEASHKRPRGGLPPSLSLPRKGGGTLEAMAHRKPEARRVGKSPSRN